MQEVLDEGVHGTVNKKDIPMYPIILKYGGIGFFILCIANFLQIHYAAFFEGVSMLFLITIVILVAYIILMVLAAGEYKHKNGGYMALSKAFAVTFSTGLLMALGNFLSAFLLFYFLDNPDELGDFDELLGMADSDLSSILIYGSALFLSLLVGTVFGAITALLISLATRKERPKGFLIP